MATPGSPGFVICHAAACSLIGCAASSFMGGSLGIGTGIGALYSMSSSLARVIILIKDPRGDEDGFVKSIFRNTFSCGSGVWAVKYITDLSGAVLSEGGYEFLNNLFVVDTLATTALDLLYGE